MKRKILVCLSLGCLIMLFFALHISALDEEKTGSLNTEKLTMTLLDIPTYTGEAVTPNLIISYNNVILEENTDYVLLYQNNVNAGNEATVFVLGTGSYSGLNKSYNFPIKRADISSLDLSVDFLSSPYYYTGWSIVPQLVVKNDDITLTENTDYMVQYLNNVNIGTACVRIVGINNYQGHIEKNYEIQPPVLSNITEVDFSNGDLTSTIYISAGTSLDLTFAPGETATCSCTISRDSLTVKTFNNSSSSAKVTSNYTFDTPGDYKVSYRKAVQKSRYEYQYTASGSMQLVRVNYTEYSYATGNIKVISFSPALPNQLNANPPDGSTYNSLYLSVSCEDKYANLSNVIWETSNSNILSVENGIVRFHAPGTATIYARVGTALASWEIDSIPLDLSTYGNIVGYNKDTKTVQIYFKNEFLIEDEDYSIDVLESNGIVNITVNGCGLFKGVLSCSFAANSNASYCCEHQFEPWNNDEIYHNRKCRICSIFEQGTHQWDDGEVTTPTTHITTGVMTYTCTVCGKNYTEVIEKVAEHNYGEWIDTAEPGCQTTGTLAHYHCECGLDFDIDKNVLEDLTIPARGHYVSQGGKEMVDSYIVQNDATYPFALSDSWYASSNKMDNTTSVFGIRATYDCTLVLKYKVSSESGYDKLIVLHNATTKDTISGSVSEKTLTLTLKAGDVVYVKYTKDSSQSSGSDTGWFKIESCTQTEIDTTVYVSTDDIDPTCTNAVICESCHQTMKEALGHTWGDWYEIKAPNCTAAGTDEHECSVCHTKETRTTDAKGHTNAEAVVENKVESNCTTDGSYDSVVYCSVCSTELSREAKVIDKLGHDHSAEWTVDVEPTCTTVGSKSHHCSRCDDRADITEVAALGHSFTDYKSNNDATYTEDGTKTAKCDRCNETDTVTDEGSALGLEQKFKDEMAALSKDANTETTYAELYSVLQTYATLSDTEKASVATEYATLQQLIENYNTKSQVANTELAEATEIAFAPIVATGFAFLAALWFLLKKKFLI